MYIGIEGVLLLPIYLCILHAWQAEQMDELDSLFINQLISTASPCSLGLSATSQQHFSLRINQPPTTSQQYFSLGTHQHQPSATSQTNRLPVSATTLATVFIVCNDKLAR
jgi:hypothetical protein